MQSKSGERELTYFGIQAEWGVTKHLGGRPATDRLAALCALRPADPAQRRVLVVGCGAGVTAIYLAQAYGCRVTGVDLSPRMAAWAQQRAARKGIAERVEIRVADALALPFAAGVFDAVLSESVTAFIPDKPAALSEYARVALPGGFVGLNEGTWIEPPSAKMKNYVQATMGGVDFMPAESWQALVTGAGMELSAAEIERIDSRSQRRAELAGLDRQDWGHLLRAYGRVLQLLLTDARFRVYTRGMIPSRQVMSSLFRHLGYGLYVGRKG